MSTEIIEPRYCDECGHEVDEHAECEADDTGHCIECGMDLKPMTEEERAQAKIHDHKMMEEESRRRADMFKAEIKEKHRRG